MTASTQPAQASLPPILDHPARPCRDTDLRLWFVDDAERPESYRPRLTRAARQHCAAPCPILAACRAWGYVHRVSGSVYGGVLHRKDETSWVAEDLIPDQPIPPPPRP